MDFASLDRRLLIIIINHFPRSSFLDVFSLWVSPTLNLLIIWFGLTLLLNFRVRGKRKIKNLSAIIAAILLTAVSVYVLKEVFARPRPRIVDISGLVMITRIYGDYSLPSFHAALSFVCAGILSRQYKKRRRIIYLLAVLISLSRIYLGVHYPVDVLSGAVLGHLLSFAANRISALLISKIPKVSISRHL